LCVCLTIAFFFIAVEFNIESPRAVAILFITAMLTLTCGLLCFLREISLATNETFNIDTWIKAE
jgi:heme/copper-type cytochrome/quinol oxidase subunit 4